MDRRNGSNKPQPLAEHGLGDCEGAKDCLPATQYQRRPEVLAELQSWEELNDDQQEAALKQVIGGSKSFSIEALVTISRKACLNADRARLNLAFEALAKRATPVLMCRAWGLGIDDQKDQVQEILLYAFKAITSGNIDFLEMSFVSFAEKKAISLFRRRSVRFEGAPGRIEPAKDADPIEGLTYPNELDVETRITLEELVSLLPKRDREIYIQYHYLELTQEEIATQHDVTVRTVYNRLMAAESAFASVRRDT